MTILSNKALSLLSASSNVITLWLISVKVIYLKDTEMFINFLYNSMTKYEFVLKIC